MVSAGLQDGYGAVASGAPAGELARRSKQRAGAAYLCKYLVLTQVFMYIEAGAVPALLVELTDYFSLSAGEQGLLGGTVYICISIASPLAGYLYSHYPPRRVLWGSLMLNNACVLLFAATPIGWPHSATILILARCVIGFSQSFFCVYGPLWVDEFAPPEARTSWMSALQSSVPLGIMAGYVIGTVSTWAAASPDGCWLFMCWRWPFVLQFALLTLIILGIPFVKDEHVAIADIIDTVVAPRDDKDGSVGQVFSPRASRAARKRLGSSNTDSDFDEATHTSASSDASMLLQAPSPPPPPPPSSSSSSSNDSMSWRSLRLLLADPLIPYLLLAISALYAVVSGITIFGTAYFLTSLHADPYVANSFFVFTAATGPTLGVFFGGWLVDRQGGYGTPEGRRNTLTICVGLGACALVAAVSASFFKTVLPTVGCIWVLLFMGGAVLPACTGIFIASVPRPLRPMASSLSIIVYNILGFSMVPVLAGYVTEYAQSYIPDCDDGCALRVGFRVILFWSGWSFLFLVLARLSAKVPEPSTTKPSNLVEFGDSADRTP